MNGWDALSAELDAWAAAGRAATFWWRDDDAARPGPALVRLLELAANSQVPLCLAVVPMQAQPELAALVAQAPDVTVAVHGYAHVNHAKPGARKAEFGSGRRIEVMLGELATGRARLQQLFGTALVPILVPPWNRIAPALIPRLEEAGFKGLSTHQPRPWRQAAPRLIQVNTHVDIIDWHGRRGFLGTEAALAFAVRHLAQRRSGEADGQEPTGLLTHHLMHDKGAWDFVAAFMDATARHPTARWLSVAAAFRLSP